MRITKLLRLSPVLGGLLLVACGGGGGEAPTNPSNTPGTVAPDPSTGIIPLDRSQALTVSAQDGSIPTPLQFSPLSSDHSVLFRADGNGPWRLQSNLATIPGSPFVNSAASLTVDIDENDPSRIVGFDYSQGISTQDHWRVRCSENCADNYRYRIEAQGQIQYFVLEAAATRQTVTGGFGQRDITNQAIVSGQIRFEIDPSWPIWNRDRFPVNRYQGDITLNGQTTQVLNLLTGLYDGRPVYIIELLGNRRTSLSYVDTGTGVASLFYRHTDENGNEIERLHDTADGNPAIIEEIDQVMGERLVYFNRSGFLSARGPMPQPAISVSGQISEKIVIGSVDAQGEVFSPKEFWPYAENESNFYRFSQDGIELNVKHNPNTENFDLAYQRPQAGIVDINIFQKFNCRLVDGNCLGIRFGEDKTVLHLEGVVLQDGRVLNGIIRNIAIKP